MAFVKKYLDSWLNLNNKCKLYLFFYMLESISAGITFFIAIFLHDSLGLKADTISIMVGFFIAGNLAGSWITSRLLDKYNPFTLSGIALLLLATAFLSLCLTRSVTLLAIIMLVTGTSAYVYMICNDYLITALAGKREKERALAISLLNVSSNIGMGIGGVIVSYLSKNNPHGMFTMMALILGISAFFYLFDCSENMAIKKEKTGTSDFQANSNVYHLSLCIIFILGLVFAQQRVGYSLFLTQYYGDSGASFIFMLNALLIIFFLPTVTSFAIKKNQILTMGSGALLLGGGMFFLCLASSSWWLTVLICLVTTLGEMLGTTLSQLLCFQYAPDAYKGKAMSYYKFLYALGTIFGTLTGGKLQMLWGENYVWFFCGIVGVLSMVLCFIAQHKEVQTRAPGNWRQQIS